MKLAAGKLGWTEYQYYTCSPRYFQAACEGYDERVEDLAVMIRNHAAITHASMGGKDNISKHWPLKRDKVGNEIMKPFTQEEIEEMTKNANAAFAKIQKKK